MIKEHYAGRESYLTDEVDRDGTNDCDGSPTIESCCGLSMMLWPHSLVFPSLDQPLDEEGWSYRLVIRIH
jgi:hypothetical protein